MISQTTVRAVINEGWQARAREVCQPENFDVAITIVAGLAVTNNEYERLVKKLSLVSTYAQHMAMNMTKGTVKYPADTYDIAVWLAEEEDDEVDRTNYRLLRLDAMRQEGLI